MGRCQLTWRQVLEVEEEAFRGTAADAEDQVQTHAQRHGRHFHMSHNESKLHPVTYQNLGPKRRPFIK